MSTYRNAKQQAYQERLRAAGLAPAKPAKPARAAKPETPARKNGKATDKQVAYAMSLLRRDHEYLDEVLGAADDDLTRRNLQRMTSAQISALISDLLKRA